MKYLFNWRYFERFFIKTMYSGEKLKMSMRGMQFIMEQRLVRKFEKVGATSMENAVTFLEAKLDLQEQYWLEYFAGSFLGKIKKTRNHTYYV